MGHKRGFTQHVALRKESVDRNAVCGQRKQRNTVALRKESVDRNRDNEMALQEGMKSLSARRAWIEIGYGDARCRSRWSLSARRAWIEIT